MELGNLGFRDILNGSVICPVSLHAYSEATFLFKQCYRYEYAFTHGASEYQNASLQSMIKNAKTVWMTPAYSRTQSFEMNQNFGKSDQHKNKCGARLQNMKT